MPQNDILLEWLAFLLAAVAWLLFFFNHHKNSGGEARAEGESLRKWTGGYRPWVLAKGCLLILVLAAPALMEFAISSLPNSYMLVTLFNVCLLASEFFRKEGLDICRKGIVIYRNGSGSFVPWKAMECVRISGVSGKVFIEEPAARRKPYKIPLADVPMAIAVLRQFVLVRDVGGRLLNPEFSPAAARAADGADRREWQFSLRSVLLLFVLASCTLSWYSIHHRRDVARNAILAKLHKFQPSVGGRDDSQLRTYPKT